MLLERGLEALMGCRRKPVVDLRLLSWVEVAVRSNGVLSVIFLLLWLLVIAIIIIFFIDLLLDLLLILNAMTSLIRILHHLLLIGGPLNQYLFDIALYLRC